MNKFNNKFFFLIFLFFPIQLFSISLVYNIKIRRIFNISAITNILHKKSKSLFVASIVPIIAKRNRHIINESFGVDLFENSLIGGSLFNVRYISEKNWWFEATTGLEKESAKYRGTSNYKISRFGLDDIILSAGYDIDTSEKSQLILYGITGFPTYKKFSAQQLFETPVGTRFFGLGGGAEFSYTFIMEEKQTLGAIAQARVIHFFDGSCFSLLGENAKVQPGNLIDLLFTLKYRKQMNVFEIGYNPTFFTNQAVILTSRKIDSPNFLRNSMYFTASHFYPKSIFKAPLLLGIGLSVGQSERYQEQSFSFWVNFTLVY